MANIYLGDELIFDGNSKLEKQELTQAEYNALTKKKDNVLYCITDAPNQAQYFQEQINAVKETNKEQSEVLDKTVLHLGTLALDSNGGNLGNTPQLSVTDNQLKGFYEENPDRHYTINLNFDPTDVGPADCVITKDSDNKYYLNIYYYATPTNSAGDVYAKYEIGNYSNATITTIKQNKIKEVDDKLDKTILSDIDVKCGVLTVDDNFETGGMTGNITSFSTLLSDTTTTSSISRPYLDVVNTSGVCIGRVPIKIVPGETLDDLPTLEGTIQWTTDGLDEYFNKEWKISGTIPFNGNTFTVTCTSIKPSIYGDIDYFEAVIQPTKIVLEESQFTGDPINISYQNLIKPFVPGEIVVGGNHIPTVFTLKSIELDETNAITHTYYNSNPVHNYYYELSVNHSAETIEVDRFQIQSDPT